MIASASIYQSPAIRKIKNNDAQKRWAGFRILLFYIYVAVGLDK